MANLPNANAALALCGLCCSSGRVRASCCFDASGASVNKCYSRPGSFYASKQVLSCAHLLNSQTKLRREKGLIKVPEEDGTCLP
jgi:hypothetical protein